MSTGLQSIFGRTQDQAVLGELLHSLSQPLTSLRCSLELSAEGIAGRPQDAFSAALEQTDRMIGVVKVMREYLDTESAALSQPPVPMGPILRSVVDQLSPLATEHQIKLRLMGGCSFTVALAEPRLRLALQYLIATLIEQQPRHRDITLRLEQCPAESELRALVEPSSDATSPSANDPVLATLHNVQLAIASRVLDSAGASLSFDRSDHSGFLLRFPKAPRLVSPDPFF